MHHISAFLACCLVGILLIGCSSLQSDYAAKVRNELARQPLTSERILSDADIAHLPPPVRTYIAYTGAVGKPIPQNFRLEFDAEMQKQPGSTVMPSTSQQYNFIGQPARFFFMKASMYGIPARVLHAYVDTQATMLVRIASLFSAVDLSGQELTRGETVTILNDICCFSPGALVDNRFAWKEVDSLTAAITFTNGPYSVSATLYFNNAGELINFSSDDRPALQDDGTLKQFRWWTPIRHYKEINGRKFPGYGEGVYAYPEGNFAYGKFKLKNVEYDVKTFQE